MTRDVFEVLVDFYDVKDEGHLYKKGDEYPRSGYKTKKERIDELSSTNNVYGKQIIKRLQAKSIAFSKTLSDDDKKSEE
jgi:hypothetical protein